MPYPTSRLLLILLNHSDGTNLESNAGYMGSLYLNPRRHELWRGSVCGGPTCSRAFTPPFIFLTAGVVKILLVVNFLERWKCIWTCFFIFLFSKTVEVNVHFWSSGLSVWCETVNWWCSSHYRLTVWIQPVLKYFSECIYLFIIETCYMKRSCVWNTNTTPIFKCVSVIFFFCKCLYFFALKTMSKKNEVFHLLWSVDPMCSAQKFN